MSSEKSFISPTATIGERVEIGARVTIEPGAVIYDDVVLSDGCRIGPGAVVGHPLVESRPEYSARSRTTMIGPGAFIRSHSVIYQGCRFGKGFSTGHGAIIREFATFGDHTVFGVQSVCDGYVQVGDHCRFHGHVGLAQDTQVGNWVFMYPHATTLDTLHPPCRKAARGPVLEDSVIVGAGSFIFARLLIGRGALIGCDTVVMHDVAPGKLVVGSPARVIGNAADLECQVEAGRRPYPFPIPPDTRPGPLSSEFL